MTVPRPFEGIAPLFCGLSLLAQGTAPAIEQDARTPDQIRKSYAPALWLGQEEPFYPVLPHPFAFDGVDNNGNGKIDLEDPDEVEAFSREDLESKQGRAAHARALRTVFGRLLDIRTCVESAQLSSREEVARDCGEAHESTSRLAVGIQNERSVVGASAARKPVIPLFNFKTCGWLWGRLNEPDMYRCGPDAVVMVGDERAKDPGAWLTSTDLGTRQLVADPDGSRRVGLPAIQYWMYYPWDAGHINDGEHVSTFFWPGATKGMNRDVKALVGAGHEDHTANNILVASRNEASGRLSPRSLPRHLPFLVELGKHASAPDFNCNGRYDIGVDSNVAPRGSWGSRDTMVSIGSHTIAPFSGWMSVERDGSGFLVEETAGDDPDRSLEWRSACPEFTRGRRVLDDILTGGPLARLNPYVAVSSHAYRLLDGDLMRRLMEAVKQGDRIAVAQFLQEHRVEFWGKGRAPTDIVAGPCHDGGRGILCISPASIKSMQTWAAHPQDPKLRARRDVWAHTQYQEFAGDFKRHLFKQFGLGLGFRSDGGNGTTGLVARISGLWIFRDSMLDAGVYFDGINDQVVQKYGQKRGRVSEVSLTFNAFRTGYYGFFGGASWHPRSSDFESLTVRGAAEKTVVVEREFEKNGNVFFGVAGAFAIQRSRIVLRAGVTAPVWRGTLADASAHRSFPRVGLLLAADFVVGFRNEKHPLER